MKHVFANGGRLTLGERIASGGEGEVFEVAGDPTLAAKLYHQPPSARKSRKLTRMAAIGGDSILRFAAWPTSTLHAAAGGPVVGVAMRRIRDARPIHELDTPAHRRASFPRADWRFLVRTARNCAAAMSALHEARVIVGDVNQGGFLVRQDAIVNLIDCDSFQVQSANELFPCEVAVSEFMPPELHGLPLAATIRTPNHDAFGLAVLIFRLLMMGRHPYAGYRGPGDMPIQQAIKEYRFAHGPDAPRRQMAPPPHSPLLSDLPPEIASFFLRAFSPQGRHDGARPSARNWVDALRRLETQLKECARDPGHYHFAGLAECPWCRIERGNGPYYFHSVSDSILAAATAVRLDIEPIQRGIERVDHPRLLLASLDEPAPPACEGRPLPPGARGQRRFTIVLRLLALAATGSLAFGWFDPAFLYFMLPVWACVVLTAIAARRQSTFSKERRRRRRLARELREEAIEREKEARHALTALAVDFDRRLAELDCIRERFVEAQEKEAKETALLQSKARERQLHQWLDRHFIKDAGLPGVGSGSIAALESYGVETAADVTPADLAAIGGLSPAFADRLLEWRRAVESRFQFDPARGAPPADLLRIQSRRQRERLEAHRKLENGRFDLERMSAKARDHAARLVADLAAIRHAAAQAEADARAAA